MIMKSRYQRLKMLLVFLIAGAISMNIALAYQADYSLGKEMFDIAFFAAIGVFVIMGISFFLIKLVGKSGLGRR